MIYNINHPFYQHYKNKRKTAKKHTKELRQAEIDQLFDEISDEYLAEHIDEMAEWYYNDNAVLLEQLAQEQMRDFGSDLR